MKLFLDKVFLTIFGIFLITFGGFFTLGSFLAWSESSFGIAALVAIFVGFLPLGLGLKFLYTASQPILSHDEKLKLKHEKFLLKPKNQEDHLHEIFYRLLETKNGLITVLNLASSARVSGKVAENFLREKLKEFNHRIITGQDGEIAYKFEYLTEKEISFLSEG